MLNLGSFGFKDVNEFVGVPGVDLVHNAYVVLF